MSEPEPIDSMEAACGWVRPAPAALPAEPPKLLPYTLRQLPGFGEAAVMQHEAERLTLALNSPGVCSTLHLTGEAFDLLADLLSRARRERAR